MSGLGTTVEPTGEPGSIVSASQQALLPETLPSNDATISQTTSVNTLTQVTQLDYIRQGTYTWASNMPAGTVITAVRIHPNDCNYVVRHVNKLFNTFTGGMKGRMRALATAWYGGDLRMGKLPPNLTEQQIYNMPLEVLTAHPNESLDPKNTGWIHFALSDQRPVAYHYNDADSADPNGFGGWFIIFVAGRLVTQSPEFNQIDIVLEFCGGFQWDQLAPEKPSGSDDQRDPLHDSSSFPLHLHPTLDTGDMGFYNVVVIQPNTITQLTAGGIGHAAIGVPNAVGKVPGLQTQDQDALTAQQGKAVSSVPWYKMPAATSESNVPVTSTDIRLPLNFERGMTITSHANASGSNYDFHQNHVIDYEISGSTVQIDVKYDVGVTSTWAATTNMFNNQVTFLPNQSVTPPNPALIGSTLGTNLSILSPSVTGESIVTFCNLAHRSISSQTELFAHELGKYKQNLSMGNTSKVYQVLNGAGTPISVWRLNPNGMFTAKATAAAIMLPAKDLTLQYLQDLPNNEPLPAPSFATKQLTTDLRMLHRRAANRDTSAEEMLTEMMDLIRTY